MKTFINNKESGFSIEKQGKCFVVMGNSGRAYGSAMTEEKANSIMKNLKDYHFCK